MAAPPPGADVQDGTGPPPQGSPSQEGSLRAPFPALGGGTPGSRHQPPPLASCADWAHLASRRAEPASSRAALRRDAAISDRTRLKNGQGLADRAGAACDDRLCEAADRDAGLGVRGRLE